MSNGTSRPPFRIAIVGGGIGGLYCALAIHHHLSKANVSFQTEVYEQAAQYKEIGAGIGLRPDAAQLIHNVGLGTRLNEIAGSGTVLSFVRYDNSGEILTIPQLAKGDVKLSPSARSELLDLFIEVIEARGAAKLHTGKACQRVEDLDDHTLIHFADSTTVPADLVIGSDGIHSQVRNQFVSDNPTFSGCIAYRGIVPISSLPNPWIFPSYSMGWLAKHRHFLIFSISNDTKLNIVAFVSKAESQVLQTRESWTSACDRKELEEDFVGFDTYVQNIIDLMPERVSKWRINDHEPLHRWHYFAGKVVLLGDAAHAMTPHLGSGGGVALADGWVLARALSGFLSGTNSKLNTLQDVAELYQAARLPQAHRVQAMSRVNGDAFEMQTPEMIDKSFEECVPIVGEGILGRLRMAYGEDTDVLYERAREAMAGGDVSGHEE